MKKYAVMTAVSAAALALSGCGKSDSAQEQAQPDNVEMPAEEAVQDVDATPVADASAAAGAEAATSASPTSAATSKP